MADIDYPRFHRVLTRCEALAARPDAAQTVRDAWERILGPLATGFRTADKALPAAETKAAKERGESAGALGKIAQPFRAARAVVLMHRPYEQVPDTLSAQPTDTDKLNAIQSLLHIIEAGQAASEPWAGAVVAGDFYRMAPDAIREANEAIDASKDLGHAIQARSTAYQPAYEAYLRFKAVVREVWGHTSREYHDIHIRVGKAVAADDEVAPEGTPAPAAPVTPAAG